MEMRTVLLQLIPMLTLLATADGGSTVVRTRLDVQDFLCQWEQCNDRLVCGFAQLGPEALLADRQYNLTLDNSETVRCQQTSDNKTEIRCIYEGLRIRDLVNNESHKLRLRLDADNTVQTQEFNITLTEKNNVARAQLLFSYDWEKKELHIFWQPLEFDSMKLQLVVVTGKGQQASLVGKNFAIFHGWNPLQPANVTVLCESFLRRSRYSWNNRRLRVPILINAHRRQPQDVWYHSEGNFISWSQPKEEDKLEAYTVYWCLISHTSRSNCDDHESIHSQTLNRSHTMFKFNQSMALYNTAVVATYSDEISGGLRWSIPAPAITKSKSSFSWANVGYVILIVMPLFVIYCILIRKLHKMSDISVALPDFHLKDNFLAQKGEHISKTGIV